MSKKKRHKGKRQKETQTFFERMRTAAKNGGLKSFARISGDKGSFTIHSQNLRVGEEVISEFSQPVEISVGTSEDGTSRGVAIHNVGLNGVNQLKFTQTGSGRVQLLEQVPFKIGIRNSKIDVKTTNWHAIIKILTQAKEPQEYFDLALIHRHRQRDHESDPHITFRPDASGKYIRFGEYTSEAEIVTQGVSTENGILVPLSTKVLFDNVSIIINYVFENETLYVDNIQALE